MSEKVSAKNCIWRQYKSNLRDVDILSMAKILKRSPMVVQMLSQMGFENVGHMEAFLQLQLTHSREKILNILDVNRALERFKRAILKRESVWIVSDYDVDGVSAASLLARYLMGWGCDVQVYIPHRFDEGYGPSDKIVEYINQNGGDLCIILDSGSNAQCLDSLTMDSIVIDHHVIQLPPKKPIVINGHRSRDVHGQNTDGGSDENAGSGAGSDTDGAQCIHGRNSVENGDASTHGDREDWDPTSGNTLDCRHLCTTGLLFLFLLNVQRDPHVSGQDRFEAVCDELHGMSILVALATVCDAMPMTAINRAIIRSIFDHFQNSRDALPGNGYILGLVLLLESVGKNIQQCDLQDFAFNVGPMINAASRMTGRADLPLRLFLSRDRHQIRGIVEKLQELNRRRRQVENDVLQQARQQADGKYTRTLPGCLLLWGESWHMGVLGIVAGRIAQDLNRAAIVLTRNGDTWQGSGRSVAGFDLAEFLESLKKHCAGLTGGGHAMAVGMALPLDGIRALERQINHLSSRAAQASDPCQIAHFHSEMAVSGLTLELMQALNVLAPFGMHNPAPVFLLSNVRLAKHEAHDKISRFIFHDQHDRGFSAVAFSKTGSMLIHHLILDRHYDLLIKPSVSYFNNRVRLQLVIHDVRTARE